MEGHPSSSIADQVLLTPRVLDEGAFETFAGRLRALIRDASDRERRLIATSASVSDIGQTLRDGAGQIAERLESANTLLPKLEERLAEADAMLERALDPHVIAGQVRDRLDELSADRVREFDSLASALLERIESAGRDVAVRVESAVHDLDQRVTARMTQAEERIATLVNHLEQRDREATTRATALERGVSEAIRRATAQAEQEASERIVGIRRQIGDVVGTGEANAGVLIDRLTAHENEAESRMRTVEASAQQELSRAASSAAARCDEAARIAESAFATTIRKIDQDGTDRLALIEARSSEAHASIHEALARVEAAARQRTEQAQQLDRSLASRLEQLADASVKLDAMIREAASGLSSLESARSRVMADTRDALELLARSHTPRPEPPIVEVVRASAPIAPPHAT